MAGGPHGRAADVVVHVEEILEAEIRGRAMTDWLEDGRVGDRSGIEDEGVAVVLELAAEGADLRGEREAPERGAAYANRSPSTPALVVSSGLRAARSLASANE